MRFVGGGAWWDGCLAGGLGPFYSEAGKAQKLKIEVSRGALEGGLKSRFCVFVGDCCCLLRQGMAWHIHTHARKIAIEFCLLYYLIRHS